MKHLVTLSAALAVVWLLWSGYFQNTFLLTLGAISVALVVWLSWRMRIVDEEGVPVELTLRLPLYAPWLCWQVFRSNVDVARVILSPRLEVRPKVIRVKPTQKLDLGRVIYANSITLTPGTVSLMVDEGEIIVHALTKEAAADIEAGEMDRRVTWLEGR